MQKTLKRLLRLIATPFFFLGHLLGAAFDFLLNLINKLTGGFFVETEEADDSPVMEAVGKVIANPTSLFPHLNALRRHIFRGVAVLALATVVSFTFNHKVLVFLTTPLEGGLESLKAIEVTEAIGTVMRVALLSGFVISLPYITFELWLFIAPAVSPRSRAIGCLAIPIATLFFIGGMAFAFYLFLPSALPFLLHFGGISTIPRPASYVGFTTSMMFWLGLSFEFPLVVLVLSSMGLVKAESLRKQWRLAIVIIAVLAALITPTVDPVNMSLVMGPLIILYLLSVGLAYLPKKGRSTQPNLNSS
jgi:sec-independent protein translocase protein TatC